MRTPIGRFGGALAYVRTDDLAAIPLRALMARNPDVDWSQLDEVILGCANQAGEDNRNVARMAALLAELPDTIPGATINRLCASGLDAVGTAARAIKTGEIAFAIAGGVEFDDPRAPRDGQSRSPLPAQRRNLRHHHRLALRQSDHGRAIRRRLDARDRRERRRDLPGHARGSGFLRHAQPGARRPRHRPRLLRRRDRPRAREGRQRRREDDRIRRAPAPTTTIEQLAKLKAPFRDNGTVTAGNASGVNDGAAALILASETALKTHRLRPRARVLGMATAGVPPRVMGIGPVPATQKLMARLNLKIADFDVIELNEAFAAQALAVTRSLGLPDDAEHVNPNGGAIALGHPLGMSGARLVLTAIHQLEKTSAKRALITLCVGVGQGVSLALERV